LRCKIVRRGFQPQKGEGKRESAIISVRVCVCARARVRAFVHVCVVCVCVCVCSRYTGLNVLVCSSVRYCSVYSSLRMRAALRCVYVNTVDEIQAVAAYIATKKTLLAPIPGA